MKSGASRTPVLAWCAAAYGLAAVLAVITARQTGPYWHPAWVALAADLVATVGVFAFSLSLNNTSVYDPYWSVAPVPILLYWGAASPQLTIRQVVVVVLTTFWAVRLTFNCLARWTDLRHEDFRYADLRPRAGRAYWPLSFAAFHLMPTALVFLCCLPLFPAMTATAPFAVLDFVAAAVTAAAVGIEAASDHQLRRFLRSDPQPGTVLKTGLWARSRHPNYFGEVLFWWGLFLFGLSANPSWWWTVAGPAAMTLLFVFVSVPLMDARMVKRRPHYADHMKKIPKLIPRIF